MPLYNNGVSELDSLFLEWEAIEPDAIGVKQYKHFKVAAGTPKMMSTIIMTATARLAVFNIKEIHELTDDDDMELERIGMPLDDNDPILKEINENSDKIRKFFAKAKVAKPKTTPQIMRMFFRDFNEQNSIMQLDENHYSICFEYQDISFAKANYDEQENIFLKWVEYLHSFNYNDHIQVVCAGRPVKTDDYKKDYIYDENKFDGNEKKIANEFNTLIETTLGNKEEILKETRLIVITTKAESLKEAQDIFMQYQLRTEEKFKELKSKNGLTGEQKTLVDRCTKNIYEEFDELFDNINLKFLGYQNISLQLDL